MLHGTPITLFLVANLDYPAAMQARNRSEIDR
jgi:hypothetical protein